MNSDSYADDVYVDTSLAFMDLERYAILILVALPLAVIIGFGFGTWRRNIMVRNGKDVDLFVGETTLGAFLSLLGLLLAFTFGNALTHSFERKTAMATEAAALGTAFLYADFLGDPQRNELKKTLLDYSRTRILPEASSLRSDKDVSRYLARTLEIQGQLWPITQAAFETPTPAPIVSLVSKSVTDVLDAHTFRMVSLPAPVSFFGNWMMIIAAGVALFLLGNRAALLGRQLSWRTFVFCVFLVTIILVILDTQRATEGYIRQDQGVLVSAIIQMEQAFDTESSSAD
ncbi:hypothetical protein [Tropicibacter sp. Alg240-R139]|uniref:hypothetical protein n=1 Tax=Tropicibacter sp. Alg240-R139 TaxID=2305991 RepID=UPI0013DF07B8|nr:hypothetical protein [Tropicibacter sp. Alg240-R139]